MNTFIGVAIRGAKPIIAGVQRQFHFAALHNDPGAWKGAGVTTGSTVLIYGAGVVGLAAASAGFLLGAAVVIVADFNRAWLEHAHSFGGETIEPLEGRLNH